MDRAQHLAWAKQRALQYVAQGDLADAFQSFLSDMSKHDQLENHIGLKAGATLFYHGHLNTPEAMKNHIEGYN
jgi:hypothetical protein